MIKIHMPPTETWLLDQDSHATSELCPTGYMLHSVPRGSRGGGVALLSKALKVKNCSTAKRKFKSFEYVELSPIHLSANLRTVGCTALLPLHRISLL